MHNLYNSLGSELDQWYQYVKENKGNKDICQLALILAKIFQDLFIHHKENPHKPLAKVKRTREEMQTTLENRKKYAAGSPRSVFKGKTKAKEGGASCSGIKREQEST